LLFVLLLPLSQTGAARNHERGDEDADKGEIPTESPANEALPHVTLLSHASRRRASLSRVAVSSPGARPGRTARLARAPLPCTTRPVMRAPVNSSRFARSGPMRWAQSAVVGTPQTRAGG